MKIFIYPAALLTFFTAAVFAQTYNDATLARVTLQDKSNRDASGRLQTLSASEHALRADVYSSNRQFPQAREHWQKILDFYPNDTVMPKALFGIARSYMWEREYEKAVFWFDRLTKDYLNTKEGREGLAFKGASLIRLNRNLEAAQVYEQYTVMFPTGERIETSFLNIIDALREAKKYDEANLWIDKARQRFAGMRTETNALQARLRMEIFRGRWTEAIAAADVLLNLRQFADSMTSADEVKYLKAFVLENSGRKAEAINLYQSIPDTGASYFGALATEKLRRLGLIDVARRREPIFSSSQAQSYPVVYRAELLRFAKTRNVDPRFVLAIMKQESSFRADAKSPAAARGLLQLTFDTALKYNAAAGFPDLKPDDLYRADVNIAVGSVYMAELKNEFGGLYEAIAASYNGGEDNAARWLERSAPKEAGIFSVEVGFAESKNYVFKVMNNYRAYRELYTEDLTRK